MNSKLHAVTDGDGRPVILELTAGNVSDYKGADMVLGQLPRSKILSGDKGYDSLAFREALKDRGIEPCIPPRKNRKIQFGYDKALYKQRHKIENMFGWIKDWRRVGTRYDRCAHTFMSAIFIAVIVIFYLK